VTGRRPFESAEAAVGWASFGRDLDHTAVPRSDRRMFHALSLDPSGVTAQGSVSSRLRSHTESRAVDRAGRPSQIPVSGYSFGRHLADA
jgi:hypothetical protein